MTNIADPYPSKIAVAYDTRFEKTLGQIQQEIRSRADFLGLRVIEREGSRDAPSESVRLLDYACGTGTISRVRPTLPWPAATPSGQASFRIC